MNISGNSGGPLPFGAAFDFFGGYAQVILVMMLFPALGSIVALLAPKPQKKQLLSKIM